MKYFSNFSLAPLVTVSFTILLTACGQAKPPQMGSFVEQAMDRHVSATLAFAESLEQYAQESKVREEKISELVGDGTSAELTEQEKTRLAEVMSSDAARLEGLDRVSFQLVDATVEMMALASAAYSWCDVAGLQNVITREVDRLQREYGDDKDVREQYDQAQAEYTQQFGGLDQKSECEFFESVQARVENVIRQGSQLLGSHSDRKAG